MQKIVFEDTTVVKSPYVTIDGVEYSVENGTYQDGTDLNANTFNQMQDNIEDSIDNVDKKYEKNIITAFFDSNYTLSTSSSYETLPLSGVVKVGDKLTLSNNAIIIGDDVSKVKISAKISFNAIPTAGVKWLTVFKGTDSVIANPCTLNARNVIASTDTLVEVQQGDALYLKVSGGINDVVRSGIAYTNITIEVVE